MKNHLLAGFMLIFIGSLAIAETDEKKALENIPTSVRCYFKAVTMTDLKALNQCFQVDAEIIDVNRTIAGLDAIGVWAENEVFGGQYEILKIVFQKADAIKLLIRFVPPGMASSSAGFKAHYTFEFKNGKITRMDLQYA